MTEEQIKQNAEQYAEAHMVRTDGGDSWEEEYDYEEQKAAYIEGAHSRDEEIKELNGQVTLHKDRADYYHDIYMKLRNPWISVEERLPEEHSKVLIMFCNGTVTYNDYIGVGDINYIKAHSKTITHWMPIPELKGK
jgi:hypothetical protein